MTFSVRVQKKPAISLRVLPRVIPLDGAQGPVGPAGPAGTNGTNGSDGAPGVVQSIVAGANVSVNSSDPANPVVSVSGGGDFNADVARTAANAEISAVTGPKYATEALGRAAVADGLSFLVEGLGDVAAYEYRRTNSTTSVLIASYPSASYVRKKLNKAGFVTPSTNRYNRGDGGIVAGEVILVDGTLSANASYSHTDYIEVDPSTAYYYVGFSQVAEYDASKRFIVRKDLTAAGSTSTTGTMTRYVRLNWMSSVSTYDATRRMNDGSVALPYEAYYQRLDTTVRFADKGIPTESLADKAVTSDKQGLLSIHPEHMAPGAVTPERASFLVASANMFDHRTTTAGFVINGTGDIVVSGTYSISDWIDVEPSTTYTKSGPGQVFANIVYYDINRKFISPRATPVAGTASFTTPAGCYFIRLNFQGTPLLGRMLNKGADALPFVERSYTLSSSILVPGQESVDVPRIDIPIGGVYTCTETYPEWTNFQTTTAAQVYALYDALVALYPSYITKQALGNDAFGNPIALYKFTPSRPTTEKATRNPKVFLTSGTHGYEHVPGLLVYLLMKDLCDRWTADAQLEALRWNVDWLVIPVVNPSGWDDYTRKSRNGVDINRNFPESWATSGSTDPSAQTYKGPSAASELETQYVMQVFANNKGIDVMYDCHNFSGDVTETRFMWVAAGASGVYVEHLAQTLFSRMTRKWRRDYGWIPADPYYAGYSSEEHGGMIQDHAMTNGIKRTSTFEVGGRWWIEPGGAPYNTTHKVTGMEAMVNWLIINLKDVIDKAR